MKHWWLIRAVRFLSSYHWRHFNRWLSAATRAFDRAREWEDKKKPELALTQYHIAESWLHDAELEWKHLEAIRDGRE